MITLDENSVTRVCYLVERLDNEIATKKETDEFMKLMYDTRTIGAYDYACYVTAIDTEGSIDIALESILTPIAEYVIKIYAEEENLNSAA